MRARFTDLIRAEAEHALAGRPARIRAKMNQLQDMEIIRQLLNRTWPLLLSTILALGLNYADHAKELAFKAPTEEERNHGERDNGAAAVTSPMGLWSASACAAAR